MNPGSMAFGVVYRQASGRIFPCVGWIRSATSMWFDALDPDGRRMEPIEIPFEYKPGTVFQFSNFEFAIVLPIGPLGVFIDHLGDTVTLPDGSKVAFPTTEPRDEILWKKLGYKYRENP